uniref:Uncharacterized protein n=1 Tax=Romanomermis culicivorax TaxID=13658 RepID=A0A915KTK6_ROMCU
MSGASVCAVLSNTDLLKVNKGGLWGGRLTVGTADDCVIFFGRGSSIWSKLKARCAAVAVFGEHDCAGRRVRSGILNVQALNVAFIEPRAKNSPSNFQFYVALERRDVSSRAYECSGQIKPVNIMLQCKISTRIKIIYFGLSRTILPGDSIK